MAQTDAQTSLDHLHDFDIASADELITAQISADGFARGTDIATAANNALEAVRAFRDNENYSDLWKSLKTMDWLNIPDEVVDYNLMNAFVDVI